MKRPLTVWIIFGACLAIVATGLVRLSTLILSLEEDPTLVIVPRANVTNDFVKDFEAHVRQRLLQM